MTFLMRPAWLLVALLALASLAFVACGDDDDDDDGDDATATTPAQTAEPTDAAPGNGDGGDAEVDPAVLERLGWAEVGELDPIVAEAMSRVELEVSPEVAALALQCKTDEQCDTGTGGEVVIGIADGFGDNVWREITLTELILQALTYPEVGRIVYTNAHGDVAAAISNMQALIAQDVDIILGYYDHGDAMLPVMREATEAGILVAAYVGPMAGDPPADYLTSVSSDLCQVGTDFATYTIEALGGEGNVVLLTGTPGNPQGAAWFACAEDTFEGSGIEVIGKADTNWTQEGTLQAVSGFLSAGEEIDAILYDYANGMRGAVRAYEQAGVPLPLFVTFTEDNGLFSDWVRLKDDNPDFNIAYTWSLNAGARIAVTATMEKLLNDADVPTKVVYPMPLVEIQESDYDPAVPDEFGKSALVPTDMLAEIF